MRALVEALENPHPLGLSMPALYQEDDFTQRFLSGFDAVLAPILCVLDNLDAYFDPTLAPDDFVSWLAGWVGMSIDENWGIERQRELVSQAADLYKWRGTKRGLVAHLALYTGTEPEIEESGAVVWSAAPGAEAPGSWPPRMTIRVRIDDDATVDVSRIEALVAAAKPAHVAHELEVVG